MGSTKAEFKELWKLNPEGDYDKTFTICNIHIDSNGMGQGNVNGAPVSYKLIYDTYKAYSDLWKRKYGKRDPKYVPSKEQLKSIQDFLLDQMYRQSFESVKTARDIYLFQNFTDEEINEFANRTI